MQQTPLDLVRAPGPVRTRGRVLSAPLRLATATAALPLRLADPAAPAPEGSLAHCEARFDGASLLDARLTIVGRPARGARAPRAPEARSLRAAARTRATLRAYLEARGFLEVRAPCLVAEPGTDVYIEAVPAGAGWLHTSPEFAIKRMLCAGYERVFSLGPVWRGEESGARHAPEFEMLEWYRAWDELDAALEDTEALCRRALGGEARIALGAPARTIALASVPFERKTMRAIVGASCGFDILDALDGPRLLEACESYGLLEATVADWRRRGPTPETWSDLFSELQLERIDPHLATLGAVFVTDWPAPLAVLAERDPTDERVARRFELYLGGVELANGFAELRDPAEQRRRFAEDLARRRALGLSIPPMPDDFLSALRWGLPPSCGVALGVDRLIALAVGAERLDALAVGGAPGRGAR